MRQKPDDISALRARLTPAQKALLEKRVRGASAEKAARSIIPRRPRPDSIPLSFAQQRLWFLNQLEPESAAYNISAAFRLAGRLDRAALERALNEIIRRHEILRTTFRVLGGQPVQIISPHESMSLDFSKLAETITGSAEERVRNLVREEANTPFNLSAGPLLRAKLLQISESEHVLILSMHHIVSDGWSNAILIREACALYESFLKGGESPLPGLPIQYADFAIWQRHLLSSPQFENQIEYWRRQLDGAPQQLDLGLAHPGPATPVGAKPEVAFRLSRPISESLNELSRAQDATIFMTLLAAFNTLLYRYTGRPEIVVGSPIANRRVVETERLIGFFANTLALRTDLSGSPSFRALVNRVREMTLAAYENQDVPFEKLVEELKPERGASRTPLFQVLFVLQNAPATSIKLPGLTFEPLAGGNFTPKFDLTLMMSETESGLSGLLKYDPDLLEHEAVMRMKDHFKVLLEDIASHPDRRISDLQLMDDAERRQLLVEWQRTGARYQTDACLHQLVEAQARKSPDAIAASYEDRRLSYADLNRRSNRLARLLSRMGVGPDVIAGVYVGRGVEMLVAVLGILKAGGAYLPLDESYPAERLRYILGDARAALLLTDKRLCGRVAGLGIKLVCIEDGSEHQAAELDSNLNIELSDKNLAYVIYTSGSTGMPKGVMVEHRSVVNLAMALNELIYARYGGAKLRVSLNGPLVFDTSVKQLVQLCYGHTLDILPQAVRADGRAFVSYIEESGLDGLDCTPSQLGILIPAGVLNSGLKHLLIAGEPIDASTWRLLAEDGRCRFYNLYGPTECTVDATVGCVNETPGRPNIGRPIPNAKAYILDAELHPSPVGVTGMLWVGGAGVARGYLQRPDLTADKFMPDPFSDEPGVRMYKTGDLARYLHDGNIEYIGRGDDQVKLRGFRIEVGEVEALINGHPGIKQCAVTMREDRPGDRRLVAYAIPSDDDAPSIDDLKIYLRRHLADYMVPSAFVILESLPLTVNGKIDRRALPKPENPADERREDYLLPSSPQYDLLSDIFTGVLGVEAPGINDNFFELGGHSLLATQLLLEVEKVFGVNLPLRTFFDNPTLAGIGEAIDAATYSQPGFYGAPLEPAAREQYLPLSYAQKWMWYLLEHQRAGSEVYNIPFALRLGGALNYEAMGRALCEVMRRHETLRTLFKVINGERMQTILPPAPFTLGIVDLSALPCVEREATAMALADEEAGRAFDLTRDFPLRARVLKLAEDDQIFLLTIHHVASDGWSDRVLAQELTALYKAFSNGKASPLPDLRTQYIDYALWQRRWLQSEALDRLRSYWDEQLSGAPLTLELRTDRPRPAIQTFRGTELAIKLPRDLADRLREICRREQTTMFMTLLAAFGILLRRHSNQDKILIGTPVAARNRPEIEGVIGFFANNLIIRADLSSDPTLREVIARVREASLAAFAHQDMPFVLLVEQFQPVPDLSRTPLFQVMFVFQNIPAGVARRNATGLFDFPSIKVELLKTAKGTANRDLAMVLSESKDGISGILQYNTDLFDQSTARRMIAEFEALLEEFAARPDARLSELVIDKDGSAG
ncbi:MAG: amino acid adenylation domain-containing protein [Blastocatellia bacterium]